MELLERYRITTFCAPPTEYRMLVKEDLSKYNVPGAAPLHRRRRAAQSRGRSRSGGSNFNLTIHDGYGQTETHHRRGATCRAWR